MRNQDDYLRFKRRTEKRLRDLEASVWVPCEQCRGKGEGDDPADIYHCYSCDGIGFKPYKEKEES